MTVVTILVVWVAVSVVLALGLGHYLKHHRPAPAAVEPAGSLRSPQEAPGSVRSS